MGLVWGVKLSMEIWPGIEMDGDGYRDEYRERATNQKMGRERERAHVYKVVVERNNKKNWEEWIFIEISCKIDKLMRIFCKNDSVK